MPESFDRRQFLTSAGAIAGGLTRAAALPAQTSVPDSPGGPFAAEELPTALLLRNAAELVRVTICAPDVIHIVAAAQGAPESSSPQMPWILALVAPQKPEITRTEDLVVLHTSKISMRIDLKAGLLRFLDPNGKTFLQESPRVPRRYTADVVNGERVYQVEQRFYPDGLEGIYGLGQHQGGAFDQRSTVVELAQVNSNVSVPFFVFTLGYAVLWNTASHSNELFSYGPQLPILIDYDRLRYRLLPYIYSLAWRVTNEDYTLQRGLPMDWPADPRVRDIGDQFMFGPALLVAPVTEPGGTRREVYLPQAPGWYDFWTGARIENNTIEASAPLSRIPVYVRAGSILPLGPVVQSTAAPTDVLEIRVYPGADGTFEWYSDAGDTYDYEKGQRRIVPLRWEDATGTLVIGDAMGQYPGMPAHIHIRLVLVSDGHGVGIEVTQGSDGEVRYDGKSVRIKAR